MESLSKDMERVLNFPEEMEKMLHPPARRYVKNAKAIFRTPADIYEHPTFYSFVLDMPGLEAANIKVKVENGILHVAGKKKKNQQQQQGNEGGAVNCVDGVQDKPQVNYCSNEATDQSSTDMVTELGELPTYGEPSCMGIPFLSHISNRQSRRNA